MLAHLKNLHPGVQAGKFKQVSSILLPLTNAAVQCSSSHYTADQSANKSLDQLLIALHCLISVHFDTSQVGLWANLWAVATPVPAVYPIPSHRPTSHSLSCLSLQCRAVCDAKEDLAQQMVLRVLLPAQRLKLHRDGNMKMQSSQAMLVGQTCSRCNIGGTRSLAKVANTKLVQKLQNGKAGGIKAKRMVCLCQSDYVVMEQSGGATSKRTPYVIPYGMWRQCKSPGKTAHSLPDGRLIGRAT